MKFLMCSVVLLAVVCSISCADEDAALCMEETGMTPEQAQAMMSPTPKFDKESFCFVGCMYEKKDGDMWDAVEPGSKEAEAKKCSEGISATDRCEVGQELYNCALTNGVLM